MSILHFFTKEKFCCKSQSAIAINSRAEGGRGHFLHMYKNAGFHTGFFEKGGKPSDTPHLPGNSA